MFFSNCQKVTFSEFLSFFVEQKFCETQLLNLGLAMTLANWKLGSNSLHHFVLKRFFFEFF
jgi:hypothetical protein